PLSFSDVSKLREIFSRPSEAGAVGRLNDEEIAALVKERVAVHARETRNKLWPRQAYSFLHLYGVGVEPRTLDQIARDLDSTPRLVKSYAAAFRNVLKNYDFS
ncbi:MAG: hypothetical protein V1811_03230, partial [Candidatus Micrarchaeota archaeon]